MCARAHLAGARASGWELVVFDDAGNAQALAESSGELNGTSQQMAAIAEETSVQARTVSIAAEQIAKNVQRVSGSTDEMGASIKEISKNARDAAKVTGAAVRVAEETNRTIARLGESSLEIGKVIKVITSIADQHHQRHLTQRHRARAGHREHRAEHRGCRRCGARIGFGRHAQPASSGPTESDGVRTTDAGEPVHPQGCECVQRRQADRGGASRRIVGGPRRVPPAGRPPVHATRTRRAPGSPARNELVSTLANGRSRAAECPNNDRDRPSLRPRPHTIASCAQIVSRSNRSVAGALDGLESINTIRPLSARGRVDEEECDVLDKARAGC